MTARITAWIGTGTSIEKKTILYNTTTPLSPPLFPPIFINKYNSKSY